MESHTCELMLCIHSQQEGGLEGSLNTERCAFLPSFHSAKVGSGLSTMLLCSGDSSTPLSQAPPSPGVSPSDDERDVRGGGGGEGKLETTGSAPDDGVGGANPLLLLLEVAGSIPRLPQEGFPPLLLGPTLESHILPLVREGGGCVLLPLLLLSLPLGNLLRVWAHRLPPAMSEPAEEEEEEEGGRPGAWEKECGLGNRALGRERGCC